MITEKEKQFLIGLEKLSRKTGIQIGGCGCCDSPYLMELADELSTSGYAYTDAGVKWISSDDDYDWKKYSKIIVK